VRLIPGSGGKSANHGNGILCALVTPHFMDDELVLLTSFFNLAGGRRQNTANTFRVESNVPSETSPDGGAALYIVTESSTSGQMGPRARRTVADSIAWEYQAHQDVPPPARLKAALRTAHEAVAHDFDGHITVGASVIAVEQDNIYLAQVAPGQVYVLHEGSLNSINASVDGTAPFERALGSARGPKILLFRDEIAAGDVLTLCSSWFERTPDRDELRDCFDAGTADDIAEAIFDLARQHDVRDSSVIVIEAALASELEAPPDEERPASFIQQVDSAMQALTGVGRMLWSELRVPSAPRSLPPHDQSSRDDDSSPLDDYAPTDQSEAPDEYEPRSVDVSYRESPAPTDMDPPDDSESQFGGAHPAYPDESTSEVPLAEIQEQLRRRSSSSASASPASTQSPHLEQMTEEIAVVSADDLAPARPARQEEPADHWDEYQSEAENEPEPEQKPGSRRFRLRPSVEPVSELDRVNSRLQLDQDMGDVIPPVQAFPDTSTEPSRIYATGKDMQAANRRPRRFGGARPLRRDAHSGASVVRPGLGDVDLRKPASRPAPSALVWASAAVFLLLVAASLYKFLSRPHVAARAPNYIALINRDLTQAGRATTLPLQERYLQKARTDIRVAHRNGTDPRKLQALSATVQTTSDNLHHITRLANPPVLTDFAKIPNARPTQIATAPGLVFILDSGGHKVFQVTPNSPPANPTQIVTAGETDNTFTIGNPTLLASDGATALVLDDHNVLVRDNAGNKTVTSLVESAPIEKIVQMTTLDPDVYLLDSAGSQLWRYPGGVTQYNPLSQPYWDTNKPDLRHGIAAAFDGTSLYLLRQDGSILKYDLSANAQRYHVAVQPALHNPTAMFTGPGEKYIWVADPVHNRVVQLDRFGAFVRAYVAPAFSQIQSIAAGPAGNTLYVLAGARLYDLSVVR